MNKYKVYVYAICKNEEKHIKRWYDSMSEADAIYVLDTGSTDNSVKLLKELGVNVKEKKYEVFKFDEARNYSLNLVPTDADICVCTDIDEIFDKGWRKELESIWDNTTDRIRYNMNFSFNDDGQPLSTYFISKIHKRDKYIWTHPIHEVLKYIGTSIEKVKTSNVININHFPDRNKSRGFYLELLEQAVLENPEDDRNMHYLGREYMYNSNWNDCIDTLIKHLNLKSSTWDEERSASMRFISRSYKALKRYEEAKLWLKKSIEETPLVREPYIEMGLLMYELKNYDEAIYYIKKGIDIEAKSKTYINEDFAWNETPFDILSLCYYFKGDKINSIKNILKALELNKNNERIKNNYKLILESQ